MVTHHKISGDQGAKEQGNGVEPRPPLSLPSPGPAPPTRVGWEIGKNCQAFDHWVYGATSILKKEPDETGSGIVLEFVTVVGGLLV